MYPTCLISINGTPVAGAFWQRLISVTFHDKAGKKSDSIELKFDDGAPHIAIPQKNDLIEGWLGYGSSPRYRGKFLVNDVNLHLIPGEINITGKAFDQSGTLKEPRQRHWDNPTLGGIFNDVAADGGMTAQVAPSLASIQLPYWAQANVSSVDMLRELERRHNGLLSFKGGKILLAERGSGQTPGGTDLPLLTVTPTMMIKGTGVVNFGAKEKHGKVKAEYHDSTTGRRRRVQANGEEGSDANYVDRHLYGSRAEAASAANSRRRSLKRGGTTTSVTIEGNPAAVAGCPMVYDGVRPGIDGIQWILEGVSDTYTKSGAYRSKLEAKIADSSASPTGPGGSAGGDTGSDAGTDAEVEDDPTSD